MDATTDPDPPSALSVPTLVVGIAVGALAVVLAVVLHRSGIFGGNAAVGAGVLVVGLGAVVALAALAGNPVDRSVVAAAVGVALTIVGSGAGRWRGDRHLAGAGGGDVVRSSARIWPLVALGLMVVAAALADAVRRRRLRSGRVGGALAGLVTEALGFAVLAATMGDVVVGQWIEGRPRRHRGRLVRPAPGAGGSPAAVWAAAARDEAAAVAAFTALADRLERVGAPVVLVARSRAAAADEVRHARRCRRLAVELGGERDAGGAPAPPSAPGAAGRTVEIVRLAVESAVDGVVGEGAAAGRLERGAATAPALAPTLAAIAGDERAHAALGADVVRWCAGQRPRLVTAAVRAAVRRMPAATTVPPSYAGVADADLRAAGLVDRPGAAAVWAAERTRATAVLDELWARGAIRERLPHKARGQRPGFGPAQ